MCCGIKDYESRKLNIGMTLGWGHPHIIFA